MDRFQTLKEYYESHNEDKRFDNKRGMVEFLITVKYIEKYLKQGMRILEIGAGTGKYSHYFAQLGYEVDAIELLDCNIEMFKSNTLPNEKITINKGDAINLFNIPTDTYDITLLLGPMYHLYTEEDQVAALSEALRATKRGGIVFAAYCNNDMTVYHFGFLKGNFSSGMYDNLVNYETFKLNSSPKEVFSLFRKEDVDKLIRNFNVTRLHYIGTDMLTRFISGAVDEMDENTFQKYMKYMLYICERNDMVGASSHMLDIFRKE